LQQNIQGKSVSLSILNVKTILSKTNKVFRFLNYRISADLENIRSKYAGHTQKIDKIALPLLDHKNPA
jgi:hypothetical protein